jgi:hypothetical protein
VFDVNVAIIGEMQSFLKMAEEQYELQQLFCTNISKDFIRQRKLPFQRLILLITRLCKRTLSLELEKFFKDLESAYNLGSWLSLPQTPGLLPCSVSAYSQRRKKLHPCFFRIWNEVLCQSFYHYTPPECIRRWHGMRVVAADGSSVALVSTPELKSHFGGQSNQQGEFCGAKTFYYYDVLNHIVVDALIAPYRTAELAIAHSHVDALADDSVTVYDRNFCTYRVMALHLWAEREKRFLIRAKEKHRFVSLFLAAGAEDEVVTLLPPNTETISKMRESGFVITSNTGIHIRLVRVELPGGGIEVLATNLMAEDGYSAQELKELYFLRWGVETSISHQKNILMLESFSGQSVISVEQDFYATVLMANLQMCLLKDAQTSLDQQYLLDYDKSRGTRCKHPMQVNRNKAAFRIKERLLDLFLGNNPHVILNELFRYFIRDVLPVRKGRSFARKRKNRKTNSKHRTFTNYKIA